MREFYGRHDYKAHLTCRKGLERKGGDDDGEGCGRAWQEGHSQSVSQSDERMGGLVRIACSLLLMVCPEIVC